LFECGEFFVPEMLIAARAMQGALGLLKPHLAATGVQAVGKVVIGTVKGDLHDIGKNLVAMMLEGAGFEIVDLGADVSSDKFVQAVDDKTDLVAMSALLTTTMPAMKTIVDALTQAGVRSRVKVMIGGAPVTQAYADQIGADGYAPDAGSATRLAKALLQPA
jgi:5-methyltetrahydrofolate--homocysteine methyltransferase